MFSKLLIIASIGLVAANVEIFPAQASAPNDSCPAVCALPCSDLYVLSSFQIKLLLVDWHWTKRTTDIANGCAISFFPTTNHGNNDAIHTHFQP
jgi:hypothetical protein